MRLSFLLVVALLTSSQLIAQDYDAIKEAFRSGNASALGRMLETTVEWSVDGELSSVGRSDAENKLRTFFMENEPQTFDILHTGESKSDVHYCISQLGSSGGPYRITLYLRESIGNHLIESIEIEHD